MGEATSAWVFGFRERGSMGASFFSFPCPVFFSIISSGFFFLLFLGDKTRNRGPVDLSRLLQVRISADLSAEKNEYRQVCARETQPSNGVCALWNGHGALGVPISLCNQTVRRSKRRLNRIGHLTSFSLFPPEGWAD